MNLLGPLGRSPHDLVSLVSFCFVRANCTVNHGWQKLQRAQRVSAKLSPQQFIRESVVRLVCQYLFWLDFPHMWGYDKWMVDSNLNMEMQRLMVNVHQTNQTHGWVTECSCLSLMSAALWSVINFIGLEHTWTKQSGEPVIPLPVCQSTCCQKCSGGQDKM